MKSKSTLIIGTSSFPFDKDEPFIEPEIKILLNSFSELTFLSDSVNSNEFRKANLKSKDFNDLSEPTLYKINWFEITIAALKFIGILIEEFFSKIDKPNFTSITRWKVAIKSYIKIIKYYLVLEKLNSKINTQLILYSYWLDEKAASFSLFKKQNSSCLTISRAHRWEVFNETHPDNYLPFRKLIFQNIDFIYPISKAGQMRLQEESLKLEIYNPNIFTKYLGSQEFINHSKIKLNEKGILSILSISFISPLKRVELIARSIYNLNFPVEWTHYGSAINNEMQLQMQNIIHSFQSKNNITFNWKDFVSHDLMLDEISNSVYSVLINLSTIEGIPVSMMEAMSFGIPVIATDVGSVNEIVTPGYNGWLLPSNPTPEEVCFILHLVNTLPIETFNMYRLNARKTWEEKYNAEKNYTDFASEIVELEQKK